MCNKPEDVFRRKVRKAFKKSVCAYIKQALKDKMFDGLNVICEIGKTRDSLLISSDFFTIFDSVAIIDEEYKKALMKYVKF